MRRTRIGLPRAVVLAGAMAVFAIFPTGAGAAVQTLYAAPEGKGDSCTEEIPCKIEKAIAEAQSGDSVRLLREGDAQYLLPAGTQISREIDLGGVPGARPTVKTTSVSNLQVLEKADATLHDIDLKGTGSLQLESGVAERVYVAFAGPHEYPDATAACQLGRNTTLRNSVCWAQEASETTAANGVETLTGDEGTHSVVTLSNVTAIASDADGHGIFGFGGSGTTTVIDAVNVIARAEKAADVRGSASTIAFPELAIDLDHSNFGTVEEEAPRALVTPAGSGTDQTQAPLFADPEMGDFHELDGSPTLDAGLSDPAFGTIDLDGAARAQPGCIGAGDTPDIGAYELNGTGPCPPPKPPPAEVKEPESRAPVFRIVKVNLHGSKGFIQIETPGAGLLTLTGSGVKLITRQPSGPGVLKLPIKPWAITLARLNREGRTTVRLKVRFAALGAAPKERRRSIVLRRVVP